MAHSAPKGWHPEQIKAALRQSHGAITRLSVTWGLGRTAISQALRRPDYSSSIELRIADALGRKPHELWPARWSADGQMLPRRSGDFEPIPTAARPNSQNKRAA